MSLLTSHSHKAAMSVLNQVDLANSIMRETHQAGMNLIWHNPSATPQEVLDELGTKSAEVFQLSAALVQFLMAIDATFVPMIPTHDFTVNPDGTIAVGDPIG